MKNLQARLRRIKLFLCDVDGLLTDGSIFIGGEREFKRFNIRDGLGLVLARRAGLKVGWVSARPSAATKMRAHELKIHFLIQQGDNLSKSGAIEKLLAKEKLSWDDVCFVGDDVVDLGPLAKAGIGVAVGDAVAEVKSAADFVTLAVGGRGAVREVIEMILRAQKKMEAGHRRLSQMKLPNKVGSARRADRTPQRGVPTFLIFCAIFFFAIIGIFAQQAPSGHATDFTSVEYYAAPNQMRMKSRLSGAEAQPMEGGLLVIKQLKLELFATNGQPQVIVNAPECIYDSANGLANSSGKLLLQNGDGKIRIEGEGFLWRQTDSFLTISNQVRTTIESDGKFAR